MTTAAPPVYLPARARAICYLIYAALTGACSAAAAGFLAAELVVPIWLKITSAVVVSLGTPLGLLAAANTTRKEQPLAEVAPLTPKKGKGGAARDAA